MHLRSIRRTSGIAVRAIIAIFLLSGCTDDKESTLFKFVDPDDSGLSFVNQITPTETLNILTQEYIYNGGGVAVGDFNNDGLSDLFFTGNMVPNKLYVNKGNLKFEDISDEAGVGGFHKWKSGVAVADVNSDGLLDIYVCATISEDSLLRANMLFVNQGLSEDGHPTFVDQAAQYGLTVNANSSNAAFFDYDNDGDLDLYVLTNSRQYGIPTTYRTKVNDGSSTNTDKLFRNNGDGTFTDVSNESGILCEGYGLGLAFIDVNKDGATDVYVGNDYITNDLLYINDGKGKFSNQIDNYIKHQSKFSMGNDVADINNDGHLDIITVDMLPETNLRRKTVISGAGYITYINNQRYGFAPQFIRNMLQVNNGNGTFSEIGQLAGIYQTEWSWSPLFADIDNDGYKDLLVTNGFPMDITDRDFVSFRQKVHGLASNENLLQQIPSVKIPNYVFKNNGDLTFKDVSQAWGMTQPSFSNGAAYADLDNDGDLDYVVNNINEPVALYENRLYSPDKKPLDHHYLRVKLKGAAGNPSGFGAKLTIRYGENKLQFHEHHIYRGYISTVEDVVHFGLGAETVVDTVSIEWPGGKYQLLTDVKADQLLLLDVRSASNRMDAPRNARTPLMSEVPGREIGLNYRHQEDDKIDFNVQRTLPHKFSQAGPAIAVGDINGDGREDVALGGSAGKALDVFTQRADGKFTLKSSIEKEEEDAGILLFDYDNDGDLDLYAVSGGYEFEPLSTKYQDRLYENNGKGNFNLTSGRLPEEMWSGSCVRAADFDGDGDLDLFVGGKTGPGRYPFPERSFLLRNDQGKFTDVTSQMSADLVHPGIVNDAIWTDTDNDGKQDLVLVGEFMPVTLFKNTGSAFVKVSDSGLDSFKGWFNAINGADFDRDGDIDYIVGNLGLNNFYNSSPTQPVSVYAKDFDGNGSVEAILSCFTKAEDGTMKEYPVHFWDELNSQSPKFRKQFASFKEFGQTSTTNFFTPTDLQGALILQATHMATSFIENLGNNKFRISALPMRAQFAPVNGLLIDDFNGDENLDMIMTGNNYGNEPTFGPYDAFTGLVLTGDGKNNFQVQANAESGLFVDGDAKGLARLNYGSKDLYMATQNKDSLRIFTKSESDSAYWVFQPTPLDVSAKITYDNGAAFKMEFYYGSGNMSQSSRRIRLPATVKELIVTDSRGTSRKIDRK